MKRWRYYVGCCVETHEQQLFRSKEEPTERSHGDQYMHALGPFYRKMDAVDYLKHRHYLAPGIVTTTTFRACGFPDSTFKEDD